MWVARQWDLTLSGMGALSLPETTMLGADMAVCHWKPAVERERIHLAKRMVLRMAMAWVNFPALIMFELSKTRNLPWLACAGAVLTRWWLQRTPFFMSACAAMARERWMAGLGFLP